MGVPIETSFESSKHIFCWRDKKISFNYTLSSRGFLTAKEIEMRLHRLHRCIG